MFFCFKYNEGRGIICILPVPIDYSSELKKCLCATLDVYEKLDLVAKAKETGKMLGSELERLKAKHTSVGDVRYIGLFAAVELVKDKTTKEPLLVPYGKDPEGIMGKITGKLKSKGFSTFCHENNVLVAPPLIITDGELLDAMKILDEVLDYVDGMKEMI